MPIPPGCFSFNGWNIAGGGNEHHKKNPNHIKFPRFQTPYRTEGFSPSRTADAAGMWTHTHKERLSLAQHKAKLLLTLTLN